MKTNVNNDNKKKLSRARDILVSIANNPRNKKFEKLSSSDIFRAKQLRNDNNNKAKNFRRYKKGSIIFVDFGTGIGNEFSHPHFCVVMDNKDNPKKGTLTVIPLTSKEKKNFINLDKNMIFKFFETTVNNIQESNKLLTAIFDLQTNPITKKTGVYYPKDKNIQLLMDDLAKRHNVTGNLSISKAKALIKKDEHHLKEIVEFYLKYNKNTYANVQAITTISKFRIFKPINPLDPIGKIVLSERILKILETAVIKNLTSYKIDKP